MVTSVSINGPESRQKTTLDYADEWDLSEDEEYDNEGMEVFSKKRGRVVCDRLENYKALEVDMSFKDMEEGRQVVNYYALANKRALTIIKADTSRTRYGCEEGCPFRCLISRDGNSEGSRSKLSLVGTHVMRPLRILELMHPL
ncbi:hypothetical protein RND71_004121 [Anisodus tanguticus]|uniref:Transposase MuDR plant domain-containing protein n=1 Tax=Anisodus tanguticus TaxID=243964 RepID=A0AAE1SXZ3_9SOLA|nr:hypothetical protein RND71_004121 [Anisodus tanguticus]